MFIKVIKKADIILIILLIAAGLAASIHITRISAGAGTKAEITIGGKLQGTYDLSKNRVIDLGTGNIVSVKDSCIFMKEADCQGHDCIHQGKINKPHQSIVCLPHKVTIRIKGEQDEYDTISK